METDQGAFLRPSSANRSRDLPPQPSPNRRTHAALARAPLVSNNSSVRIRRLTSSSGRPHDFTASDASSIGDRSDTTTDDAANAGRRRSLSAPQRPTHLDVPGSDLGRQTTNELYAHAMPSIQERTTSGPGPSVPHSEDPALRPVPTAPIPSRPRGLSDLRNAGSGIQATFGAGNAARANRGLGRIRSNTVRSRPPTSADDEYDNDVMGLLDLVGE